MHRPNHPVSHETHPASLGVRLRDDATFANFYPGVNAAALGYVERLCSPAAGGPTS